MGNKILIVEDDYLMRELYKKTLNSLHYKTDLFSSSKKANDSVLLNRNKYIGAVLDFYVHDDITGLQLAETFRNYNINFPILFISAYNFEPGSELESKLLAI